MPETSDSHYRGASPNVDDMANGTPSSTSIQGRSRPVSAIASLIRPFLLIAASASLMSVSFGRASGEARRYERSRGGPPNPGAAMNENGRITTPWRKKSQQIPNMLRCRYDLALYGDMNVMDVKPKMAAEICRTSFWERETRV